MIVSNYHWEVGMVEYKFVVSQLNRLGLRFRFVGRAEVRELANIINPGEGIRHCAFGYYQGGSALLVATEHRLLLIDKRPFFLNLEDIRYEMINEVDFAARLLDATVHLHTGNKKLTFRSFSDIKLRNLCEFVQNQITKARQLDHMVQDKAIQHPEWRPVSMISRSRIGKYGRGALDQAGRHI